MGFYLAEGLKTNDNRISVANSESSLIKRFMIFLKSYFGVTYKYFYLYIRVDDEKKNIPAIKFWSDELGLKKEQITATKINVRPPKSNHGNAELVLYNTTLSHLFMSLFYKVFSLSWTKSGTASLLKGIESGDGYVMEHGGIEIGVVTDKKFADVVLGFFRKVCSEAKIRDHHTSKNAKIIFLKGRKNATSFLLDGHFSEHEKRRGKLIELLKHYLRRDIRYLSLLKEGKTVKEISNEANVTFRAANIMLKKLENDGFLRKKYIYKNTTKTKRKYKTRAFKLTERGNKILEYLVN